MAAGARSWGRRPCKGRCGGARILAPAPGLPLVGEGRLVLAADGCGECWRAAQIRTWCKPWWRRQGGSGDENAAPWRRVALEVSGGCKNTALE